LGECIPRALRYGVSGPPVNSRPVTYSVGQGNWTKKTFGCFPIQRCNLTYAVCQIGLGVDPQGSTMTLLTGPAGWLRSNLLRLRLLASTFHIHEGIRSHEGKEVYKGPSEASPGGLECFPLGKFDKCEGVRAKRARGSGGFPQEKRLKRTPEAQAQYTDPRPHNN
jgi:hypothetical protein